VRWFAVAPSSMDYSRDALAPDWPHVARDRHEAAGIGIDAIGIEHVGCLLFQDYGSKRHVRLSRSLKGHACRADTDWRGSNRHREHPDRIPLRQRCKKSNAREELGRLELLCDSLVRGQQLSPACVSEMTEVIQNQGAKWSPQINDYRHLKRCSLNYSWLHDYEKAE
jgi:hypothetical protein